MSGAHLAAEALETQRDHIARGALLVVDDDPTFRRVLQVQLERCGYSVLLADSADSAESVLAEKGPEAISAILTDYQMPWRSGLDLIHSVRMHDSSLASVMITADEDREVIASSMRGGFVDFLQKPITLPQLLSAVDKAVRATAQRRRSNAAENALAEIASVQQAMIDSSAAQMPIPVTVYFHPKQQAGGDFVSTFPITSERFLVLACDVSGHDPKAAFISSYFQGIVRGMMEARPDVATVFSFFNRFLIDEWNRDGRATREIVEISLSACAFQIDAKTRYASVLNCGFPGPLLVDSEGRVSKTGETVYSPLGWFPNAPMSAHCLDLGQSVDLRLWSDGLDDVAATLNVDPLAVADALVQARRKGTAAPPFLAYADDDVMYVRVADADRCEFMRILLFQEYPGSSAREIDAHQEFWRNTLGFALPQLSLEVTDAILLCIREAVLNALLHGCESREDRVAALQINFHEDTSTLEVRVSDPGPGHDFDLTAHAQRIGRELVTEHRGLLLIHHFAESVHSSRRGAELRIRFACVTLSEP
jgi:FixJ family two-component response regulator/anti-sigma regulatory factor (Ser/Thr protein kinase)